MTEHEHKIEQALFHRMLSLFGTKCKVGSTEYDFQSVISSVLTEDLLSAAYKQKNTWWKDALSRVILETFFDILFFDEQKYVELIYMPIPELYNKMAERAKEILQERKMEKIQEDF